jgi:hypothetical protein
MGVSRVLVLLGLCAPAAVTQGFHLQRFSPAAPFAAGKATNGDLSQAFEDEDKVYKSEEASAPKRSVNIHPAPRHQQCLRYRWEQDDDWFRVEMPLPRLVADRDLSVQISGEALAVAVNGDPSFGVVGGFFSGAVDVPSSRFELKTYPRSPAVTGQGDVVLDLILRKSATPGTSEMWHKFLKGEKESPTVRFSGETRECTWEQKPESVEIAIPIPSDKDATDISVKFGSNHVSLTVADFLEFERATKGPISPLECIWLIDSDARGASKKLVISLAKGRSGWQDEGAVWWSGVFFGDDQWGA